MAAYVWKRDAQQLGTAAGLYPFAGAVGIGDVAAPGVILGGIALTPAALAALGAVVTPGVILGSLTLTPATLAAVGLTVAPTMILGNLILTPAALAAVGAGVAPGVILGNLILTPAALAAVGAVTQTGVTVPIELTLRDRRATPGDSNIRNASNMARQGVDERMVYLVRTTTWSAAVETAAIAVHDRHTGEDVSDAVLAVGDPLSSSGPIITTPVIASLTAGHWYSVEIQFSQGQQTFECYFMLIGEE